MLGAGCDLPSAVLAQGFLFQPGQQTGQACSCHRAGVRSAFCTGLAEDKCEISFMLACLLPAWQKAAASLGGVTYLPVDMPSAGLDLPSAAPAQGFLYRPN